MVLLTPRQHCRQEKSFLMGVRTQLDPLHTYVEGMTAMTPKIEAKPINSCPSIPKLKNIATSRFTTIKKETQGALKGRKDLARAIQPKP